jgi:hypothetical protein
MKEIKYVEVGDYACAVKMGKCPMFAITYREDGTNMILGLQEDFPDYKIVAGGQAERQEAAKRIIMKYRMQAGR